MTAVMRWPEKLAAGGEVDEIVSVLDMLPTLTHAAGVDNGTKKKIDGVNRWSTITGKMFQSGKARFTLPLTYRFTTSSSLV